MMQEPSVNESAAKKIWLLVDQWLEIHQNESFNLETICRQLEITQRENRNSVARKLAYEVHRGKLEKSNRIYRSIDLTLVNIDWVNAIESELLPIRWPVGHEDGSCFSFNENVHISPGDIIVIAGGSNFGKTTFCLNLLWDNMDDFPVTVMGNEYQANKFKRRVSHMTWAEPINEHGAPKFELIERYEGWKDIIRPDNINIIDWINLEDKFYLIGSILQGIKSKLRKGIAVVALQKKSGTELGTGGGFSQHLASLYLSMDYERITVTKCKEWNGTNPNGMMDSFTIVDSGTQFHDIHRIKQCPQCHGYAAIKHNTRCECAGKGFIDA